MAPPVGCVLGEATKMTYPSWVASIGNLIVRSRTGSARLRAVAQLAEQRSPKPQVAGSIPVRPANAPRDRVAFFVYLRANANRVVLDNRHPHPVP